MVSIYYRYAALSVVLDSTCQCRLCLARKCSVHDHPSVTVFMLMMHGLKALINRL